MAQVILCDAHNMEHPADWLVTHMADGEAQAYCDAGYMELMVGFVEAANAAEADQTAADAERRLAAAQAPAETPELARARQSLDLAVTAANETPASTEPATAKAITRELADWLTALGMDPTEAERFAADSTAAQLAKPQGTEPAHVIRRGQSQKARQHQAAQELRAEREAATATATAEPGDDDEDDDADAQEAATPPA